MYLKEIRDILSAAISRGEDKLNLEVRSARGLLYTNGLVGG